MQGEKAKAIAIIGIGGAATVGAIILANRASAQPPPVGQLPAGFAEILATKTQTKAQTKRLRKALFSIPNDVTFAATGTVSAGKPDPNMKLFIQIVGQLGNYEDIWNQDFGAVPVGQSRTLTQGPITPQALATLMGGEQFQYSCRTRMVLANSSGSIEIVSTPQTFQLNPITPTITPTAVFVATDKSIYAPLAQIGLTLQLYNPSTSVGIAAKDLWIYLNGVAQKIVTTTSSGFVTTTLGAPLGTGIHTIRVDFKGDAQFQASSGSVTIEVQQAAILPSGVSMIAATKLRKFKD